MRISKDYNPYLSGDKYSNGLKVKFLMESGDELYRSRSDVLAEICTGKRIIHVGCVDHDIDSIEKKIKRNKWLHKNLCEAAERCFGVDIQEDGIRYLREVLGYEDVAAVNIIDEEFEPFVQEEWDYLLLPEVLEHIDNPVDFLSGIRRRFIGKLDNLIITVPNAFSKDIIKGAQKDMEFINSDHRYWFTPYTLAKVAVQAGFSVQRFIMCKHGIVKRRSFARNAWFRRHPLMRGDVVMILSF